MRRVVVSGIGVISPLGIGRTVGEMVVAGERGPRHLGADVLHRTADPRQLPVEHLGQAVLSGLEADCDGRHRFEVPELCLDGRHSRSNRSTGRTKTVAPPTSTSSG